jgi:hypothetical protein
VLDWLDDGQAALAMLLSPLPQTARALGMCPTWICVLRRRFAKVTQEEVISIPSAKL